MLDFENAEKMMDAFAQYSREGGIGIMSTYKNGERIMELQLRAKTFLAEFGEADFQTRRMNDLISEASYLREGLASNMLFVAIVHKRDESDGRATINFENAEILARCYDQFSLQGGAGVQVGLDDRVWAQLMPEAFFSALPNYDIRANQSKGLTHRATAERNGYWYFAIFDDEEAEKYGIVLPEK